MTARTEPASLVYIYVDGVHCAGTVEQQPGGRWRASTRHELLGYFDDRDTAIAAVHAALDSD